MAERTYRDNLHTDLQGKAMIKGYFALISEQSMCTLPNTLSVAANCAVRSSEKWALLSPCQHLQSDGTAQKALQHTGSSGK